jgi:ATP/maltotriose-dependent transcriptional regulator MalT
MKQSQHFLDNAENCAQLAERADDEPTHKRYKRMEAAWRALAEEQDWLDGEVSPVRIGVNGKAGKGTPAT